MKPSSQNTCDTSSVPTPENDFTQLGELLMRCDRTIYSNIRQEACEMHADSHHLEPALRSLPRPRPDFQLGVAARSAAHVRQRTPLLMNSTQRLGGKKTKNKNPHLHTMFDLPPQKMWTCCALLLKAACYVRYATCEEVDEKLISPSALT